MKENEITENNQKLKEKLDIIKNATDYIRVCTSRNSLSSINKDVLYNYDKKFEDKSSEFVIISTTRAGYLYSSSYQEISKEIPGDQDLAVIPKSSIIDNKIISIKAKNFEGLTFSHFQDMSSDAIYSYNKTFKINPIISVNVVPIYVDERFVQLPERENQIFFIGEGFVKTIEKEDGKYLQFYIGNILLNNYEMLEYGMLLIKDDSIEEFNVDSENIINIKFNGLINNSNSLIEIKLEDSYFDNNFMRLKLYMKTNKENTETIIYSNYIDLWNKESSTRKISNEEEIELSFKHNFNGKIKQEGETFIDDSIILKEGELL